MPQSSGAFGTGGRVSLCWEARLSESTRLCGVVSLAGKYVVIQFGIGDAHFALVGLAAPEAGRGAFSIMCRERPSMRRVRAPAT